MKMKDLNGKFFSRLILAALSGFCASLGIAAVGSVLVSGEKIGESAEPIIVVIALLMGSLISALMTTKQVQGSRIIMSLTGAGSYFLVLLCCGALVFDGIRSGVGISLLMALCSALVVWIMGPKGSKKAKYRLPKS